MVLAALYLCLLSAQLVEVINLGDIDFLMPMGVQGLPGYVLRLTNSVDHHSVPLHVLSLHCGFNLVRQPAHVPLILNIG